MGEYHHTLDSAMDFPLEAYLALLPALIARKGGRSDSPDYVDQAAINARTKAWEFLRAHFHVLEPGEPGPSNALARWIARGGKPKL
jgi:hypothetical protein